MDTFWKHQTSNQTSDEKPPGCLPCKLSKPNFPGIDEDSTNLLTRLEACMLRGGVMGS